MQETVDGAYVVLLVIPAEPRWLALSRLVLSGICQLGRIDDETLADLKLAVTEACTNAILHAYGDGAAGDLVVRYRFRAATVEIEVEDDGSGFDPDDPGARVSELGGEGMGLLIIRTLTDLLEIESDASGSRVFFTKAVGRDAEDGAAPAVG